MATISDNLVRKAITKRFSVDFSKLFNTIARRLRKFSLNRTQQLSKLADNWSATKKVQRRRRAAARTA
jgi:hypothetical protein